MSLFVDWRSPVTNPKTGIVSQIWGMWAEAVSRALQPKALARHATTGHALIPTMAGAPTGVPTVPAGAAALVYDTVGHKLWVWSAGTWRSVGVA